MTIDDALILKLEKLAHLSLADAERVALKKDLEEIINMIDKLGEVDTTHVQPLMHLTGRTNVLRADEPAQELKNEEALANAPASNPPYFKVPKVIRRD